MEDDLVPTALVARVLDRHLRLPASWDDVERREFVDEGLDIWPTGSPAFQDIVGDGHDHDATLLSG